MTACRPGIAWAAALVLACACAETHSDSIDASMSQHFPSPEAGVVSDSSDGTLKDAANGGDAEKTQPGAADSGAPSDAGAGTDCQQSQLDGLAGGRDNPSIEQLLDTLLDKLEHGEHVPYCSVH